MPELRIYGSISPLDVSAAGVTHALDAMASDHVDIRINSTGGSVYEGIAIHNAIARHPARITAHIDSIAASSASFIAQAADEILINPHARMMIHDPWSMSLGNAIELGADASNLNALGEIIATIYAGRAGGTAKQWRERMQARPDGVWYNADEAVAAGLADRIEAAPSVGRISNDTPATGAGLKLVVAVAAARRRRNHRLQAQKG